MSNRLRCVWICAALLALGSLTGWSDTVELTDGRKIEGLVVSESPVEVTVKLETGATVRFPRSRVRRITRAEWQDLVREGDRATDPARALEYYEKAKELNPSAPGIDEKIADAKRRVDELQKQREQERQEARRKTEDQRILEEYQRLMDAVQPDEARELLENAIEEKPYLCLPRIKLAEIYERNKTPEGRVKYIDTLVGLVTNDCKAYYAVYAPVLVEAAENLLLKSDVSASMSFDLKDRLLGLVAPFVGTDGELLSAARFRARKQAMEDSPVEATLAKVDFLKHVCAQRPAEEPPVEPERTQLLQYKSRLDSDEARAALRRRVNAWLGQASLRVTEGEMAKAAALGEVVLIFRDDSVAAQAIVAASRVEDIRRQRARNQYDRAIQTLQAAENILPDSPQLGEERARLYLALADRETQRGNFAQAIQYVQAAGQGRIVAPQVRQDLDAAETRVFDAMMGRAQQLAGQKNYAAAIQMVERARQVDPLNPLTLLRTKGAITKYKDKLREGLLYDLMKASHRGERIPFDKLLAVRTRAQNLGVWTMPPQSQAGGNQSLKEIFDLIIQQTREQAKRYSESGDMYSLFKTVGRLSIDPELRDLSDKAMEWVNEGNLPAEFFYGTWQGSGVTWTVSNNSWRFVGYGLDIDEQNLYGGAVQMEARQGNYVFSVERPGGRDTLRVNVLAPHSLLLISYTTPNPQDAGNPRVVGLNAMVEWVPPQPTEQPQETPESSGPAPSPDQES